MTENFSEIINEETAPQKLLQWSGEYERTCGHKPLALIHSYGCQQNVSDGEKMTALDTQIRELYDEIMAMPKMIAFNEAKEVMDKLLGSVNYIISMAANGEDPMTCPEEAPHSCSGSCASCGGCH